MVYKKHSFGLIIRLLLIIAVMSLFPLLYLKLDRDQLFFTSIVIGSCLLMLILELINYSNKTNKAITHFVNAIKHKDFSLKFSNTKHSKSLNKLYQSFDEIIEEFKQVKIEKELHYQMISKIIELIPVGLICINEDGKIVFMNGTAMDWLHVKKVNRWEHLQKHATEFCRLVETLNGEGTLLWEPHEDTRHLNLSIKTNSSKIFNRNHLIISFQDMKKELEHNELKAYLRLIRTLNHEIMNSVTPIDSLTETILMILADDTQQLKKPQILTEENLEDIQASVKTIKDRSNNLFSFVNEYRKLSKLPEPNFEMADLIPLINDCLKLFEGDFSKENINIQKKFPAKLSLFTDATLFQQAFINLLKNSLEALKDKSSKTIRITVWQENQFKIIEIADNGPGIPEDILEDIFIPFFTTKPSGSGIGLSLTKQIFQLLKAEIRLKKNSKEGCSFIIRFNDKDLSNKNS